MSFETSIIGSLPRPSRVLELLTLKDEMDPEEVQRELDQHIKEAVSMQERVGLDVISDGEWRRASYIGVIAELAHGFELSTTEDGRPLTIVTGTLSPKTPGFIAREATYLHSITEKKINATLPSPALLGERMWHPDKSKAAYPTREAFVSACVPILKKELELLKDAGTAIVQIDDPHLCLFVDEKVRAQYDDADAAASFDADTVNELVDGVNGLTLAVHLCRRAGARARGDGYEGVFDPIMQQINSLNVQHVTLEFTAPGSGDTSILQQLREDIEIGLGCVSVFPGQIDSTETIVERVEEALKYVDPERIVLNPDCGFAPGSAAKVELSEVEEKLQNEVSAAKILRERYSMAHSA